MNLMKCAILFVMMAVVVNAEESKSPTEDKSTLTSSSSSENKQQSKRGAPNTIYGSPQQLSTGFTPLTSTYPNVNGYLGGGSQQQTYASAALLPVSNDYGKTTYSAAGVYPLQGGVKYASHPQQSYTGSVQYPRVSYVQPMNPAYAQYPQVPYASQSGVTYVNTPSYVQAPSTYGYPSVAQHNINTQYHSQPLPFNQYSPSSFQPVSPIVHATPVASIAPTTAYYQQAAYQPTYHQNPQITKVAVQQQAIYHQQPAFYNHQQPTIYPQQPTIYPQQPNYYHPSSYQPSTYQPNSYQPSIYQPNSYQPNYQPNYQATKQGTPSVAPAPVPAIINSKPIALQAPLASSSSSSVEHGQHSGAVSYSLYSNEPSQNKASLISTQPQQHQLYYQHQQPQQHQQQQQPIYAYNKQIQYANAQPSYHANSGAVNYGSQLVQQPYAHINKIAYTQASYVQPTAPALIASSSSSTPLQQHKIHYH